jgi:XTP/dITP diphosphohydrolase
MGVRFAGSRIKSICRLGLSRGEDDVVIAQGEFSGKIIAPKNNDHKGREFELFVVLDGMDKVMLEYSTEEKNEFSHRGRAMKNLLEILKKE